MAKCTRCPREAGSFKWCLRCRKRQRAYYHANPEPHKEANRQRVADLTSLGICAQCRTNELTSHLKKCDACTAHNLEVRRKRRSRLRAKIDAGEVCSGCLREAPRPGRKQCDTCRGHNRKYLQNARRHVPAAELIRSVLMVHWPLTLEQLAAQAGISTRTVLRVAEEVPGLVTREIEDEQSGSGRKIYLLREVVP